MAGSDNRGLFFFGLYCRRDLCFVCRALCLYCSQQLHLCSVTVLHRGIEKQRHSKAPPPVHSAQIAILPAKGSPVAASSWRMLFACSGSCHAAENWYREKSVSYSKFQEHRS